MLKKIFNNFINLNFLLYLKICLNILHLIILNEIKALFH